MNFKIEKLMKLKNTLVLKEFGSRFWNKYFKDFSVCMQFDYFIIMYFDLLKYNIFFYSICVYYNI